MFKISYLTASLFSVTLLCAFGGPTPSHKDVQYSKKYSRSKLDVWLPENTSTPCPIIVYFHGGGFKAGDKSKFYNNRFLTKYLEKGISFASVNYPLLKDAGYLEIMTHTSESIKFLKSQAKEWNIDPNSIAVMGSSAGAMISEFLAYSQDLGITACYALQQPHKSQFLTGFINKGDPPLVLFTKSGKNDKVHHPDNASFIKAQCDSIGVDCLLYGSKTSGLPQLPDNKSIEEIVLEVFLKQWEKNTNTILESH